MLDEWNERASPAYRGLVYQVSALNKRELLALTTISFQYLNTLKTNKSKRKQLSFLLHYRIEKPVGWMYPSCHPTSKHTNKTTENTTRQVNALAMCLLRAASDSPSFLRSKKNPAPPKQARMAKRNKATAYVMFTIMKACV